MTQFAFGSGTLIGVRTDVTGQPPAFLGTLQDVSLDFDRKVETLLGQHAMAIAAGGGEFKISGKAKNARLQASSLNNLFLGQTLSTAGMLEMAAGEADNVSGSPYQVTVTNSANWTEDLGVFATSGGGQFLPGGTATASYYSVASGVYSFNSGDSGDAVTIYYNYTTNTGKKITMANQLMGPVPLFQLNFKGSFTYFGAVKDVVLQLNACFSPKLSLPFTNTKFAIQEFDFQAIADQSNNIGTISMTE